MNPFYNLSKREEIIIYLLGGALIIGYILLIIGLHKAPEARVVTYCKQGVIYEKIYRGNKLEHEYIKQLPSLFTASSVIYCKGNK